MQKTLLLTALLVSTIFFLNAQKTTQTKGEKFVETIKNLPEDLIKQPDAGPDSNANKLVSDNLSIEVHPLWKEKGTLSIIEYKMQKCDFDPVKETFPLSDQKLVQVLTINMNTAKKTAEEKKQQVLAQVSTHLAAYYKEAGVTVSKEELAEKVKAMVVGNEKFTTAQGRSGDLYFIHDIQSQQAGFIVLLLLPGTDGKSVTFVQFNYIHFVYETTLPEDAVELRTFQYPQDQETYIDFTKKILKTLVIK